MTTELVTAHAGTNHVGSEDVGAMQAATLGAGRYAVELGDNLAVSMDDANTVRIGTGGFFLDGRFVRVSEAETVKVANGSQGAYRKDLVTYTYERDPSSGNVETGTWGVLQGTAAAKEADAKVPEFEAGNVLDGDLKATVAVAEVDLAGLTPTARLLLPSVASLKSLGESVSPRVIAETASTSWQAFDANLAGAQVLALVSMAGRRPIVSTVCLASQFTGSCTSAGLTMQATYSAEPDSYKADAYWAGGRLWMKSSGQYDRSVMLRLV